ncbi:MAG: hypothetical protein B6U89_06495 [Desulfurococcales archaeon ex4484_58]|nr:MAG: hypothetical protein B6U89_06495 [Desulfurococcales archaeon ex4484_58]
MIMFTINETGNETGLEIIWEAFKLALKDLVKYLPSIFLALAVIAVYILIIIVLNSLLRRILRLMKVDELAKPLIKQFYIRPSNLIILLADIGIVLLAIYSIILLVLPQYIVYANEALYYIGRVVSIIFIIITTFIFINVIVGYIRIEAKLRGFMFLLLLFITLTLIIDITTLSQEIKTALAWGISIGITLLIAVFSIWFFFHEIIERKTL